MYLLSHGNESSGSKLNCLEAAKKELGKVIGGETGWLRKSVDAKERYRVAKQKLFKHAFISPFDAMEMLMVANGEKRA